MKFLLINGCGTCKNNIRIHSFFEVELLTNIIIITKKVNKQV